MTTPILKAHKYRIYPNLEQEQLFAKSFGCTRFVWNWALRMQKDHYELHQKFISKAELQNALIALKSDEKTAWLKEVNSQSLLNALLNLDTAFRNYFHNKNTVGFPCFKSKKMVQRSYQNPQHATLDTINSKSKQGSLNLPKIKGIRLKLSRPVSGKIKTVTISQTASHKYYASVLVETDQVLPISATIEPHLTIGIDCGISTAYVVSDGTEIVNRRFGKTAGKRLAVAQKRFARTQANSKNRQQRKLEVARIHEHIKNQRHDSRHQLTHRLVSENQATSFAVEDLAIKNMVRNSKLSKAILDVGWGDTLTTLRYKAAWFGKNVLTIGRFKPSSKTCSDCGYVIKKLPLSIRTWCCPSCNSVHDRDRNASINIRNFALADALGQLVLS
jgi:putative transposase